MVTQAQLRQQGSQGLSGRSQRQVIVREEKRTRQPTPEQLETQYQQKLTELKAKNKQEGTEKISAKIKEEYDKFVEADKRFGLATERSSRDYFDKQRNEIGFRLGALQQALGMAESGEYSAQDLIGYAGNLGQGRAQRDEQSIKLKAEYQKELLKAQQIQVQPSQTKVESTPKVYQGPQQPGKVFTSTGGSKSISQIAIEKFEASRGVSPDKIIYPPKGYIRGVSPTISGEIPKVEINPISKVDVLATKEQWQGDFTSRTGKSAVVDPYIQKREQVRRINVVQDEIVSLSNEANRIVQKNKDIPIEEWSKADVKKYNDKLGFINVKEEQYKKLGGSISEGGEFVSPTESVGLFGLTREVPITDLYTGKIVEPFTIFEKTIGATAGVGTERGLDVLGYQPQTTEFEKNIYRKETMRYNSLTGQYEPPKIKFTYTSPTAEEIGKKVSTVTEFGLSTGKYFIPYFGGALYGLEVGESVGESRGIINFIKDKPIEAVGAGLSVLFPLLKLKPVQSVLRKRIRFTSFIDDSERALKNFPDELARRKIEIKLLRSPQETLEIERVAKLMVSEGERASAKNLKDYFVINKVLDESQGGVSQVFAEQGGIVKEGTLFNIGIGKKNKYEIVSGINPSDWVTVYHGTSEDLASQIVKKGLKPSSKTGIYQGIAEPSNFISVALSADEARGFAMRTSLKRGSPPTILQVSIPKSQFSNLLINSEKVSGVGELRLKEVPSRFIERFDETGIINLKRVKERGTIDTSSQLFLRETTIQPASKVNLLVGIDEFGKPVFKKKALPELNLYGVNPSILEVIPTATVSRKGYTQIIGSGANVGTRGQPVNVQNFVGSFNKKGYGLIESWGSKVGSKSNIKQLEETLLGRLGERQVVKVTKVRNNIFKIEYRTLDRLKNPNFYQDDIQRVLERGRTIGQKTFSKATPLKTELLITGEKVSKVNLGVKVLNKQDEILLLKKLELESISGGFGKNIPIKLKPERNRLKELGFIEPPKDIKRTPFSKTFGDAGQSQVQVQKVEQLTKEELSEVAKSVVPSFTPKVNVPRPLIESSYPTIVGGTQRVIDWSGSGVRGFVTTVTEDSGRLTMKIPAVELPSVTQSVFSSGDTKGMMDLGLDIGAKTREGQIPEGKTRMDLGIGTKSLLEPLSKERLREEVTSVQALSQKQRLDLLTRQLQKVISKQRGGGKVTKPRVEKVNPFKLKVPKTSSTQKGKTTFKDILGETFEVFKRTKGEDVSVGEEFSLGKAGKKLSEELKGSLSASGFVVSKRTGKKVPLEELGLGFEFAKSKVEPLRIIQRKEKRLGSGVERSSIQFFRKSKKKDRWL